MTEEKQPAGTAIAERNPAESVSLIEKLFPEEHRKTIAAFLGVKPENPALPGFLAFCAQWELDPFAGQIWLIKQRGRDGGDDRYRPAAGRDGFLAIANRQSDFVGVFGDVVREKDIYEVEWEDDPSGGMRPRITHKYAGGRTERGGVVGAWARVDRRNRPPQYYFAPLNEHAKNPDKSAWSYVSAMILKSAYSMALRLSFSITGVVPVDEMHGDATISASEPEAHVIEHEPTGDDLRELIAAEGELHDDQELQDRIFDAVTKANELSPLLWTPVKLQMTMRGRDREGMIALAAQIESDVEEREKLSAEEEGVTDAEVVEPDSEESSSKPGDKNDASSESEDDLPEGVKAEAEKDEKVAGLRKRLEGLEVKIEEARKADDSAAVDALVEEAELVEAEIKKLTGEK